MPIPVVRTYDDAVVLVSNRLGISREEAERRAREYASEQGLDCMSGMLVYLEEEGIYLGEHFLLK